jgi:hypothetical protein
MNKMKQYSVLSVAIVGLLALVGCGGGDETPVATPPPPSPSPTDESPTDAPTVIPTPTGQQATVVDVINTVDAHPVAEAEWEAAVVDMTIYEGGEVWAQEASTARVDVADALVRVAPNTIFTFGEPVPDSLRLNMEEGQMWIDVGGLDPDETFEVETPGVAASVRGTRFSVRAQPDGATIVSTRAGTVTVAAGSTTVSVTAGYQTTVLPGASPESPVPMSMDEQVRWGMAMGSDLEVVLPAVGGSQVFSYTGSSVQYDLSSDGTQFAYTFYYPSTGFNFGFYDVVAGMPYTLSLSNPVTAVFFDPAGDRFAYQSPGHDGYQICIADLEGVTTGCFGGDARYGWPFWSPDGEWIAFYSDLGLSGEGYNLFRARPDGSDFQQLTSDPQGYNIRQAWSPDGEWLAFVKAAEYRGVGDLWVMRSDGSDQQMLFEGVYANGPDHVVWSPDGASIAVPAETGGLYIVPVDGSEPWMVPGTEGWACWEPAWSPSNTGWPLFFSGIEAGTELTGLWTSWGDDAGPGYFAGYAEGAVWRPIWASDGSSVAIRYGTVSLDNLQVFFRFFEMEPDFWR